VNEKIGSKKGEWIIPT